MSLNQILNELRVRDKEDLKIDRANRKKLVKEGLPLRRPVKFIEIDTSKIEGVEKVVDLIISQLDQKSRIISIEGLSGVGKSSTAELLQKKLKAIKFSIGEIFRYLTYKTQIKKCPIKKLSSILKNVHYRLIEGHLCLFDGKKNITQKLTKELYDPKLETVIPKISALSQKIVIQFLAKQLEKFKKRSKRKILIEGRAFTLDFLPTDFRIRLTADIKIRAKRRQNQIFNKNASPLK